MAEIKFTPGQLQAINDEGKNILVAASAGSGKTRVLVERVIRKIKEKTAVDEMLILTFTEAAAREMKERIQGALRQAINAEADPETKRFYLQQLTKLNVADISTIDAFCLRMVQKYYYLAQIDPDFRLLTDETERALLRESVWEDLREELYGELDPLFEQLTLNFSNDRSDDGLTELVMELFDFANVNPDPKAWLENLAKNYHLEAGNLEQSGFYRNEFMPYVAEQLQKFADYMGQAAQILESIDDPEDKLAKLKALYHTEEQALCKLAELELATISYNELKVTLEAVEFKRAPAARLDDEQKVLKNQAQALRDETKKQLNELLSNYFNAQESEVIELFTQAEILAKKAAEVVLRFMRRYQAEKKRRHVLEFSDLEHLTLKILRQQEDTSVKELLQARYQEIMVDEYQDTNQLQEAILTTLAQDNMFMVGDVKQSIYAFRLADPTLFLGKYHKFGRSDDPNERIILAENFRSAENITATTNFIFSQIMDQKIGEMDYDKNAQLVYGAKDYPEMSLPTEILLYTSEEDPLNDPAKKPLKMRWDQEPEAMGPDFEINSNQEGQIALVAKKIKELHDEKFEIYDREAGQMRPITYGDIAILSETRTNHLLLSEELKRLEIPFYVQKSQNYFQTTELRIMLALLALIDNPYQDIELAAVLRSPIVGLKENELAYLRINDKSGDYFHALEKFYQDPSNQGKEPFVQALYAKIARFMEQLQGFRDLAHQNELATLIQAIYEQTGFLDYVGGMPGGPQRQANLHALYERAAMYEQSSFKGLFQFIGFIKKMQEKQDDLSEAVLKTSDDTVNIMTIHGSKGLEFPIVFLIDAAKKFNMRSLDKKYILSEKAGLAMNYLDQESRIEHETLVKNLAKQTARNKSAAEKMRLLYVALTRAKEKLFIVAGYDSREQVEKLVEKAQTSELLLPDDVRANAKNFMDWILPAVARRENIAQAFDLLVQPHSALDGIPAEFALDFANYNDIADEQRLSQVDLTKWFDEQTTAPTKLTPEMITKIDQILAGKYQHEAATRTAAYQAVSDIKRLFDDPDLEKMAKITPETTANREVGDFKKPRFMTEEVQVTPAAIGTAIHLLFQELDLTQIPTITTVNALLQRLIADGLITPEVAKQIDVAKLVAFYTTPLGQELLKNHTRAKREVAFSMVLPAGKVFEELDETLTDPILVHGIMDGYFITENDEVVLFDYKTDRIYGEDGVEKIMQRYQGQLNLYQTALEQILNKPVNHKYLYLVELDQAVELL